VNKILITDHVFADLRAEHDVLAPLEAEIVLVVREVLIGGDDDTITIRHSIPTPKGPDDPSYLLRGSSHRRALRAAAIPGLQGAVLELHRRF